MNRSGKRTLLRFIPYYKPHIGMLTLDMLCSAFLVVCDIIISVHGKKLALIKAYHFLLPFNPLSYKSSAFSGGGSLRFCLWADRTAWQGR